MPKLRKQERKAQERGPLGMQEMRPHLRGRGLSAIHEARSGCTQNTCAGLNPFLFNLLFYQLMDKPDLPVSAIVSILMDTELLDVVKTALKPEAESPSSERSMTEVSICGNELVIETFASDTTALRASLNSYLRWVQGIQGIVDIL